MFELTTDASKLIPLSTIKWSWYSRMDPTPSHRCIAPKVSEQSEPAHIGPKAEFLLVSAH